MTRYKRGDIILVPFPFTDFSTVKQRPAIVLSSDGFNEASEDLVAVGITSQLTQYRDEPHSYLITGKEQHEAGLPKESIARCGKILTIDQRLVRKILGRLPAQAVEQIVGKIHLIIN